MRISELMPPFKMPGTRVRGTFPAINNPDGPEYIVGLAGDVIDGIVIRVSIETVKSVNSPAEYAPPSFAIHHWLFRLRHCSLPVNPQLLAACSFLH